LNRAADWFRRQRISRAEMINVESTKHIPFDENLAEKLLEEAKDEAQRRNTAKTAVKT